jgi:hypothetical protein
MPGSERDHAADQRLHAFRHERLQDVPFDRQPQPRHGGDAGGIARARQSDLARADEAARCLHTSHPAVDYADVRHLAVPDNVDAPPVCCAGIAPHHGIVLCRHVAAADRL